MSLIDLILGQKVILISIGVVVLLLLASIVLMIVPRIRRHRARLAADRAEQEAIAAVAAEQAIAEKRARKQAAREARSGQRAAGQPAPSRRSSGQHPWRCCSCSGCWAKANTCHTGCPTGIGGYRGEEGCGRSLPRHAGYSLQRVWERGKCRATDGLDAWLWRGRHQ